MIVFPTGLTFGQEKQDCLQPDLPFVTSALERILRDPRAVLEDEENFWKEEKAQVYTQMWADNVGFSISRPRWREGIQELADLTREERLSHPLLRMAETIIRNKDDFLVRAIPHICSYLPDSVDISVPIYFTAFVPPRAFAMGGLVLNVSASYWKGNPDNILNSLVHEVFHVGYSQLRSARSETPLAHKQLYQMLDVLHNEGYATYVAYGARDQFPAPDEVDFRMLDSPEEVRRQLGEVNAIFREVGRRSQESLQRYSWEKGVEGRAYYIAGAHMAQVIDAQLGRDALVGTLLRGPVSFVETYNTLVSAELHVLFPDNNAITAREEAAQEQDIVRIVLLGLGLLLFVAGLLWYILRRHRRSAA
ncbi:MAG: DUF5700 domain-containing putative Zn-dependent protease [Bacteroidota bacterium]